MFSAASCLLRPSTKCLTRTVVDRGRLFPSLSTVVFSNKMSSVSTRNRPVVITGPSGCGKSTLLNKFLEKKQFKNKFGFSVSHTTRSPRSGEVEGVAYHFTTKDNFEKMLANEEFLEWAEFGGNLYGTSKQAVRQVSEKEGSPICLLDLEINGVEQLKLLDSQNKGMNCFYILVTVASMEILEERLRGRGTETELSIQKRLERAKKDAAYGEKPGFFDVVIINDNLDSAYDRFENAMLEANPHLKEEMRDNGDS